MALKIKDKTSARAACFLHGAALLAFRESFARRPRDRAAPL